MRGGFYGEGGGVNIFIIFRFSNCYELMDGFLVDLFRKKGLNLTIKNYLKYKNIIIGYNKL